jgi:hypothetical protein
MQIVITPITWKEIRHEQNGFTHNEIVTTQQLGWHTL